MLTKAKIAQKANEICGENFSFNCCIKDIFSPKETLDCSTINFRWLYCSSEICECLIMSDSSCLFVGNGVNVIQTSFLGGRT